MILHIINKSAPQHTTLSDTLPYINDGDSLVFYGDGVYTAVADSKTIKALKNRNIMIGLVKDDCICRGISLTNIVGDAISMQDFVQLTLAADKNISW